MKRSVLYVAVMAMLCFFSKDVFAQGPGYIIRQAGTVNLGSGGTSGAFPSITTISGKEILNPDYASGTNQNNYATVSTYSGVWSAVNDETGSEIPYAAVPPYSSEPYSDLRRGPSHLYSDFVPGPNASNSNASYYMYYRSTANSEALCFRLRMGSIMPGAKSYSILIDADGKFGATGPNADPNYVAATTGTNGNSGFELEVDLFTQTSGQTGIALYNVDGTSSPVLVWSANDYTQFSQVAIAGTNDNGDPDFYLDFFIPWNKITGISSLGITPATTLRFIPTTVMAPLPAIGGPKSDIYGLNDALYPDPNVEYETLLSAMPGFTINQLNGTPAGSIPNTGNIQLCTAAPAISSVTTTGGANSKGVVSGTWSKLSISSVTSATISVYLNGTTLLGTTTATMNNGATANWTFDIPSGTTLVSGNAITAKAQGQGGTENSCQTSNTVLATSCSNTSWAAANFVAPIGGSTTQTNCLSSGTTSKGIDGANRTSSLWTIYVNESFANTTQNSTANQGAAGFTNGGSSTTFTTASTPDWKYSSGCSGGSNMGAGMYIFWYQDANGCKSEVTPLCVTGTGPSSSQVGGTVNVVPSVSPGTITPSTTSVIVTGAVGSLITLYYDGDIIGSGTIPGTYNSTTPTSGTITFSNLAFQSSGVVSATSKVVGATISTSYCIAKSTSQIVTTCITSAPFINNYSIGKVIAGTGTPGAIIKLYQTSTSGTLLATVTVGSDGVWTTTVDAVASTTYVATAQSTTCSLSAASAAVTTNSGVTDVSRCGTITNPATITSGTTGLGGNVSGSVANTKVSIYLDNMLLASTTTGSNTWGNPTPVSVSGLYNGGTLSLSIQEPNKDSVICPTTYKVTCTLASTADLTFKSCSSGCTEATVKSGNTLTYTISGATVGNFYSLRDSATGKSLSTGVWASSTSFDITTNSLANAGSYKVQLVNSSVSSTEMCSVPSLARIYTVLPITLLEFKGARVGNTNLLTWKTAQEINASRFDVEKSIDGITYAAIGAVPASGSNTSYSFTDNQPQAVSYYRLKLVDRDNQYKYSKVILMRDNGSGIVLNAVRPNPFDNEVKVSLVLPQAQKVNLLLMDASGRQVQQRTINGSRGANDITLSGLSPLPQGIYVLKVNCDGALFQEKLVKMKY